MLMAFYSGKHIVLVICYYTIVCTGLRQSKGKKNHANPWIFKKDIAKNVMEIMSFWSVIFITSLLGIKQTLSSALKTYEYTRKWHVIILNDMCSKLWKGFWKAVYCFRINEATYLPIPNCYKFCENLKCWIWSLLSFWV